LSVVVVVAMGFPLAGWHGRSLCHFARSVASRDGNRAWDGVMAPTNTTSPLR
jgi:hypothetical protein